MDRQPQVEVQLAFEGLYLAGHLPLWDLTLFFFLLCTKMGSDSDSRMNKANLPISGNRNLHLTQPCLRKVCSRSSIFFTPCISVWYKTTYSTYTNIRWILSWTSINRELHAHHEWNNFSRPVDFWKWFRNMSLNIYMQVLIVMLWYTNFLWYPKHSWTEVLQIRTMLVCIKAWFKQHHLLSDNKKFFAEPFGS